MKLQLGHVDTETLASSMTSRIIDSMSSPEAEYIVMRSDKGDVAAVAHWTFPLPCHKKEERQETAAEKAKRLRLWDQGYREMLPANSNKDLILAFTASLRELRDRILQGMEHFLLENVATYPDHRGKGLASQLIEWALPQADQQNVPIYLDTANDNPAMRIYKRLGFEEKGSNTIDDLVMYGGEGSHTHVALLRLPSRYNTTT